MSMATPGSKRLYQAWRGRNVFFCGGRLIFGPDAASVLLTAFLITGPSLGFCSQLFLKINSSTNNTVLHLPALIVALLMTLLNLVCLFLTSSRDPGIIPRNTRPPDPDELIDDCASYVEWESGRNHVVLPRTKDSKVNGTIVKVKFCETCLLYRLPRASHCSICNNCVQRFDHHCPWVGQCIGLRNYRFFFLFISSSSFLCIYVFTFSWLNIIHERKLHESFVKTMKVELLSVLLIVYTFIAIWFVGGLTLFHVYLICTNQTTYENFRYNYDKKENPYNNGILRNFKELFLSRIPPSMCKFRSWVLEESYEIWSDTSSVYQRENSYFDGGSSNVQRRQDSHASFVDSFRGSTCSDNAINPFSFKVGQTSLRQEPQASQTNKLVANEALSDKAESSSSSQNTSTPDSQSHLNA